MNVSKEQIEEWRENPVTEALLGLAEKELHNVQHTPDDQCYVFGKPFETQELIAQKAAQAQSWLVFCDLLVGDWSYLEEDSGE